MFHYPSRFCPTSPPSGIKLYVMTDGELLRRLVERRCREAFTELVSRYVRLVYGIASRQLRDSAAAEDVTQSVFFVLWQKPHRVHGGAALAGWLVKATRLKVIETQRRDARRMRREQVAAAMKPTSETPVDFASSDISLLLDECLARLRERDRTAITLRFLREMQIEEVAATMGATCEATRKRISRAMDKIRADFQGRGISTTSAALPGLLLQQAHVSVPATLVEKVVSAVCLAKSSAAAAVAAKGAIWMISTKHTVAAAIVLTAAAVFSPVAVHLVRAYSQSSDRIIIPRSTTQPTTRALAATRPSQQMLLTVLDASTGNPIPGAKIDYASRLNTAHAVANDQGQVVINFHGAKDPWVTAHFPHYVGLTAQWRLQQHGPPPAQFTIRIEPGVAIGGKVVDDAAMPIAGAHVVIWIMQKTYPDPHVYLHTNFFQNDSVCKADGRWQFDNVPSDGKLIELGFWDYQHLEGDYYSISQYSPFSDLLSKIATVTLRRGVPVSGVVYGADGKPLRGARVALGADRFGSNSIPAIVTDANGAFSFAELPNRTLTITTTAKGCSPDLQTVVLGDKPLTLAIHLTPAHTLKGSVVDAAGKPLKNAYIWVDTWRDHRSLPTTIRSNAQGSFTWAQASADTVYADVEVQGYARQNNVPLTAGELMKIVMQPPLTVSGTVVDADTGEPIAAFSLVHGIHFNDGQPLSWETQLKPDTGADGKFTFTNRYPYPGYAVKIVANGYMPETSRVFSDSEHHVELQFKLHKAADLTGRVVTADGKPAAGATAVLVEPGEWTQVVDGREVQQGVGQKVTASADGSVRFTPTNADFLVVALGDGGVAQVTADQWRSGKPIVLQPWARIEGVLRIGKSAGAGRTINVSPDEVFSGSADFMKAPHVAYRTQVETDSQGRFVIDRVVPRKVMVSQIVRQSSFGQSWFDVPVQSEHLTLAPGQTAHITLGGMGRQVVGEVRIPPQFGSDWMFESISAFAAEPAPPFPDSIKNAPEFVKALWLKAFFNTEAGKAYQSKAEALALTRPQYGVQISHEGHYHIDDVPAGDYEIDFAIARQNLPIATAHLDFTVPPMPTGRSDEPLQLPTVTLKPTGSE